MHEEAGTFTLLPGARGFHGLFGARADPVRYRAVRAVIGLHMRRHLRYFTTVLSGPHALHGLHHRMGCARIAFAASSHVHLLLALCFRHRRLWPRAPMHEEAGTLTQLPGPEATMVRLERALTRSDTARCAL